MKERLLRRKDVQEIVPMSTAAIYSKMKDLKFPKVHKYGGTAFWKLSEIQEYIEKGENYVHQKLLKQKDKLEKVS
ncbi:helix-turn-helix transcriptional regulator [Halarcobacter anaerophilus]|uniref:helix-turn-helix transcriptional regulator n=1 Tax=Halarcobacter anaerophilus TaxID=877500 RepID=UPI0005CB799E|nr:AlpA family phage regulatory protein [Halarcobacter anaerophilus]